MIGKHPVDDAEDHWVTQPTKNMKEAGFIKLDEAWQANRTWQCKDQAKKQYAR